MIAVGIDVAKDKHDGFILSLEGEALADVFIIPNNAEGIDALSDSFHYLTPTHAWKREIPDICAMPFLNHLRFYASPHF